ncbi:MAG TPA: acetate uptake transporter [Acidimicrobiales bacterium]|nr:acetate uptake transporter [Acidimicrobiales bacterium]
MSTDIGSEIRGTTSPVNMHIREVPGPADPAPLGLAAFALTTFLLSAKNAHWTHGTDAWLGFAFAYGGLAQLLAGMWEFRNRNVFGATAFSTYGGFWIGLATYVELVAPNAKNATQINNDLGWILLAFLIFNSYMLLWSASVNLAVFGVFLTLEATEILLVIANFSNNTGTLLHVAGYVGVATAAVAWYTSAAGVLNGMWGRPVVFVGRPFVAPTAHEINVGERV